MAQLSNAQLQALKAAINANPTWAAFPQTSDGHAALAATLNMAASPDYWVIRTSISQMELQSKPDQDGGTFDWASPGGFISRSQGERDAWRSMFQPGNVNPCYAMVRQGFDDIFSGTAVGAVTNRTHWRSVCRRKVTSFEQMYVTATAVPFGIAQPPGNTPGSRGATTNPDTLGLGSDGAFIESPVTAAQVQTARELP